MARRTDRAPHPTRSVDARRRTRSAEETLRMSGLAPDAVSVPRPREDADAISSGHPIMHWVLVADETGRTRPEARWL
ncbi:hypothetical protein ACOQFV_03945 [Nocardiopsis changdeensis]|uniref:Uncharacterized protein n=1 Tax=Nocardiopsis changdeensis TaxID=2831969 RepID=A0ABX8BN87_9ACTN|nr:MULTISPECIES: hypothetical protein [Nocardiopsis]QUX22754.1 hypothetical protein KGD84_31520 [Nocardiopsis changdeensis]QYX38697.1 hypothetical protein K1J57_08895 [Nocardiopsis sp. MT53]